MPQPVPSPEPLRIRCVGGGPAGMLFAILAARAGHQVDVVERQEPDESFGWGVVFWDNLLDQLDAHDPAFATSVRESKYTWRDQVVEIEDQPEVRIPSFGFSMRRRMLLDLLRERALQVGVRIENGTFETDFAALRDVDLLVAADGVNSRLRGRLPGLGSKVQRRRNRYIWLGTDAEFDSFTFPFVQTPHGWVWAHAYGFDRGASTFLVETTPQTWRDSGFDSMAPAETMRALERIFARSLHGHTLHPQAGTTDRTPWNEFAVVTNEHWHTSVPTATGETAVVLLGDAAHTTHFSIGSGTRLAMEDAMALSDALAAEPDLSAALQAYEHRRQTELAGVQRDALRSTTWFEQVPRYVDRPARDLARMMDDRRSPVMPLLPVGLYLGLTHTMDRLPWVAAPLRRIVSKVLA